MATAEPVAARKRRPKGHFAAARAKRPRGSGRQLEAGMRGILITCNMNERKCVGEAYSLLGEYGDLLYGPEQVRAGCPGRDGLSPRPGGGKGLLGGGQRCSLSVPNCTLQCPPGVLASTGEALRSPLEMRPLAGFKFLALLACTY